MMPSSFDPFDGRLYPRRTPSQTMLEYQHLDLAVVPSPLCPQRPITSLDLSHNPLVTWPSETAALPSLTRLNLAHTTLTQLPDHLRACTQLEELYLSGCPLECLPSWLSELPHLRVLDLSHTRLTMVPDVVRSLPSLQVLSLSGLPLAALPPWLDACALHMLFLRSLTACDLSRVRACSTLEYLDLGHLDLTQVPDWIQGLPRLQQLDLSDNPITELPAWVGDLPLTTLHLAQTRLQHRPDWEAWTMLRDLNLSGMTHDPAVFAGAFPASLTSLKLYDTALTAIPPFVRNLQHLETLRFDNNASLSLPAWLLEECPLKTLELINTHITEIAPVAQPIALEHLIITAGRLPTWPTLLDYTPHLRTLDLSETRIVDATCPSPCVLPRLVTLDLQGDAIAQLLPQLVVPMLQRLTIANCWDADLTAVLQQVGQVKNLAILNCSGTVPEGLRSWTHLQTLNMGHNGLRELPRWISELEHLESLNLAYNDLARLPLAVRELSQLHTLDITANPLRSFPDWLHTMPQLHAIEFQFPPDDLTLHDHQLQFLAAGVRCNVRSPRPRKA
ncbi:leucine-rich repeat-containing protein typical subtype [Herpetosiphon aurantiacus DSM 785]|uniref:Leucine-rich repeat-containing protein typical subtype n=1 Tax=Herpetosiphon aurantiacus (strain ATCC 23779 / DSM 785 / 114-95) TaxID=316274 RepID=A9AVK6_HERA2|nr:leucine-rich repeat-containing protein typical subtype [Herpetosiphon aurantiacus DSM 785]